MSINHIPTKIKVGVMKNNSNSKFITLKRRNNGYLFASDFFYYTGYTAVDKPRDPIVAFEREVTDKVRDYDNVPTKGFKLGKAVNFRGYRCVAIYDPRGWVVRIRTNEFLNILQKGTNLNNGILEAEFVYSIIDDCWYNLVIYNSDDYQKATKEDEDKKRRKELRKSKNNMNLVPGKVYDYLIHGIPKRVIYLGQLKNVVAPSFVTYYQNKSQRICSQQNFDLARHVWLKISDSLDTRDRSFDVRFQNSFILYDNLTHSFRRNKPVNLNKVPRDIRSFKWMFLDDYSTIHNFEFSFMNIFATNSIDTLAIKGESMNQSYVPENATRNRKQYTASIVDKFPIKWTLQELQDAVIKLSNNWWNCYQLYQL